MATLLKTCGNITNCKIHRQVSFHSVDYSKCVLYYMSFRGMRFHPAYDIINVCSRLGRCNAPYDWLLEYSSQSCHAYSSFYKSGQWDANPRVYSIILYGQANILKCHRKRIIFPFFLNSKERSRIYKRYRFFLTTKKGGQYVKTYVGFW